MYQGCRQNRRGFWAASLEHIGGKDAAAGPCSSTSTCQRSAACCACHHVNSCFKPRYEYSLSNRARVTPHPSPRVAGQEQQFNGKHARPHMRYLWLHILLHSLFLCSSATFEASILCSVPEMVHVRYQRIVLRLLANVLNSQIRVKPSLSAMRTPHTISTSHQKRWLALLRCCEPLLGSCVPCKHTKRMRTLWRLITGLKRGTRGLYT